MRGQVYNVPRGLVWDMVLGVEERESEVIASKRERESTKRESVQCVTVCRKGCVYLGLTLILLSQYLTLLNSTFKSSKVVLVVSMPVCTDTYL